ncbi:serine/threonine protein kinase [Microcoleus sp. FACHB-672]|nr:serine/threonine protein kinase [Microcoleus sp. FACHB-672]
MSFCLNPKCPNPSDLSNNHRDVCRHCGSELVVRNRYRIVRPLGGGGFGKTFEVDDQGTLKVLKILYKNHPKAVELFQQEATVLSRLQHPGIPTVEPNGYFTFLPHNFKEPLHCLVMEKIQGLNLEEWMKERENKPLSQEEALDCLKKIAEILDKVHQQQFFHRDIKPLNIMRRPNSQLVLIDFGAAREVTSTYLAKVGQGQNVTGIVSPGYTPPEQVNGKAVPQSDFYALGRTFVYLMTGSPPTAFPENPRTGKLIWREKAPQINLEFADVIDYLMAPFPGNRPQNAQMILQCLADIEPGSSYNPQTGFSKPRFYSGNSNLLGRSSREISTSKQGSTASKNRQKQKAGQYKKLLIRTGALALLFLASTQLFSYWRYGNFPANPIRVLASIPSSRFLQKSVSSQVGHVNAITISPVPVGARKASNFIFASASYGTLRLWEENTGKLRHAFFDAHSNAIGALAMTPDGKLLASGSTDKTIRLWNLEKNFRIRTIPAHAGSVNALAISPDGKTLISASDDKTIRLWRLPTGKRILTIPAHAGPVNALAISPSGEILASGSDDNTIKLWDLSTGKLLSTFVGHKGSVHALAISPDGKTLVSGSADNTVKQWNLGTGKLRRTLEGHSSRVRSLAISPNGKTLVSAGDTIMLWNLKTGKHLETLLGHANYVSSVAITPDGKTLISGSRDQTIKIWQMP